MHSPFHVTRPVGAGHSRANDVIRIRRALTETGHGFSPRQPPGVYDPSVQQSIKRFQRDNGLKPDAVVLPGSPTERAIRWELDIKRADRRSAREAAERSGEIRTAQRPDKPAAPARQDNSLGSGPLPDDEAERGQLTRPQSKADDRADGGQDRPERKTKPEQKSSTEKIEWETVKLCHDKGNFDVKVKGPIKVELHTQALSLDGLRYTVDWLPLNAEGKIVPVFRNPDHRPKEGGRHVSVMSGPVAREFSPPFDNPHGFEVRVRVPPQQAVSGNTTGAFLNIYVPKGGLVK